MPSLDSQWLQTFQAKKTLFGSARVAVGGRDADRDDDDLDGDDEPVSKRGKPVRDRPLDSLEPVFFHNSSSDLWEEILHGVAPTFTSINGVVDFCPGDGVLAHVCLRKRIPYLGFCFTEDHRLGLLNWLTKLVWQDYTREGSEFYQNPLAVIMESVSSAAPEPQPAQAGRDRGWGRGGGRGRSGTGAGGTPGRAAGGDDGAGTGAAGGEDGVVVEVEDDGPGVAEEELPRLGERG